MNSIMSLVVFSAIKYSKNCLVVATTVKMVHNQAQTQNIDRHQIAAHSTVLIWVPLCTTWSHAA